MNIQGEVAPHDHQALALFVRDFKHGVIVQCEHCGNENFLGPETVGRHVGCVHCRYELLYPAGASW